MCNNNLAIVKADHQTATFSSYISTLPPKHIDQMDSRSRAVDALASSLSIIIVVVTGMRRVTVMMMI